MDLHRVVEFRVQGVGCVFVHACLRRVREKPETREHGATAWVPGSFHPKP